MMAGMELAVGVPKLGKTLVAAGSAVKTISQKALYTFSSHKQINKLKRSLVRLSPGERVATLKVFADSKASKIGWQKNKVLGTKNGNRDIYTDKDGEHWSLDTQHGHFEKLNKRGKHLGAFDLRGSQVKPPDATGRHDIFI